MTIKFCIYYGDGSTHNKDPYLAPAVNVQAIRQEGPDGRVSVFHSKDAYYWNPEVGWNPCDDAGMWDHLLMFRGPKAIIFGRSIRDKDYWMAVKRATEEAL